MKPERLIFLAAESIPFGPIDPARPLVRASRGTTLRVSDVRLRDGLATRIAAAAVMFGGLAALVWLALGYVAAL